MYFFWKSNRGRKGNGEREERGKHYLPLVHFPDGYNSHGWARSRPKAWTSTWIAWVQALGPSSTFPDPRHTSRQLVWKRSSQDLNWHLGGMLALQAALGLAVPTTLALIQQIFIQSLWWTNSLVNRYLKAVLRVFENACARAREILTAALSFLNWLKEI